MKHETLPEVKETLLSLMEYTKKHYPQFEAAVGQKVGGLIPYIEEMEKTPETEPKPVEGFVKTKPVNRKADKEAKGGTDIIQTDESDNA